jgi:hypothetical protein
VHTSPSPFKQTTPLKHIPLFHETIIITLTSCRWISTGRMFFKFKNLITKCNSQLAGLVIDMVLYKVLTQQSIHSMAQQTLGA